MRNRDQVEIQLRNCVDLLDGLVVDMGKVFKEKSFLVGHTSIV